MSTHRAILPPHETKCIASTTRCSRTDHCARHGVAYVPGRPVENYSIGQGWNAEQCGGFLPIDHRAPGAPQKVHEAPKGIC